jgi:hypothetical protein
VFGAHHYYCTANPEDFFGTHAEGFDHCLFAVMNELEGAQMIGLQGKMNYAFITKTTNKTNPEKIDQISGDRRNVAAKSTDVYLGKLYTESFWTRLNAHFRSPEFIRCLYDYLNGQDLPSRGSCGCISPFDTHCWAK